MGTSMEMTMDDRWRRDNFHSLAIATDVMTHSNESYLYILQEEVQFNCSRLLDSDVFFNETCFDVVLRGNGTNATETGDLYYFYEKTQFTVMWILFIFIVVGNTAVLAALLLSKARKSRTNFFIMHLALADLSVGLISVLTDIVWKSTVSWNAGNAACKIVRFAQWLVTYSSTYVLVALSIDRYDAITHPMNFSGSWRRARHLVRAAWMLSVVFSSPSLSLFQETIVDGVPQCWMQLPEPWHWQLYMALVTLTVFVFPTIIITGCYAIIVYTIWSKSKIMTPHHRPKSSKKDDGRRASGPGGAAAAAAAADEEGSRRASSRGLIPKAKIKTVKMTLVIVFVFVLCWSPYFVFDLLQVYGYIPATPTFVAVATFIQSLAPLNSAANPVIYCLFSTHLCRNLRRIRLIDWIARSLFPCFRCSRRPLDPEGPFLRSGTEYTTMSDVSSRRHYGPTSVRYNVRYSSASRGVVFSKSPSETSSSVKKGSLNTELLAYNCGSGSDPKKNEDIDKVPYQRGSMV
ncbi:cardioacceleratory peptide receptor-like isoform X2 [Oratosquilla oratoria]|uniref:cardioacceleratory peptide receptor-like isoform X2 n=1 Tax=Oratosquilla oratoria TaxID=337810 RepID=UPI003F7586C2